MANRQMRYDEVKGVRAILTANNPEQEFILDEPYEYIKVEELRGLASNGIAVYINNAAEDDYLLFADSITLEEIEVKKVRVKVLNNLSDYKVQITLMR